MQAANFQGDDLVPFGKPN